MGLPTKFEMRTYYKEAWESFTDTSTLLLPPQLQKYLISNIFQYWTFHIDINIERLISNIQYQ